MRTSFAAIDQFLHARGIQPRTLSTTLAPETLFSDMGKQVSASLENETLAEEIGLLLKDIIEAVTKHFPENIFWDFHFMAGEMTRFAAKTTDSLPYLAEMAQKIIRLQGIFGEKRSIRFRYTHDFLYGFDWAKWIAKSPENRTRVRPYDLVFLERMIRRGEEIFQLIEKDDEKYHQLTSADHRNPFRFSRQTGDEIRLLQTLVEKNAIPVPAWQFDAIPNWEKPYNRIRNESAAALGIIRQT